jgi:hypothetical protein
VSVMSGGLDLQLTIDCRGGIMGIKNVYIQEGIYDIYYCST